jgi:hypothetical protein
MTMKSLSLRFHTMMTAIATQQQKMTRHWLKETSELRDNERIQSISETTIRSRLKEQGF